MLPIVFLLSAFNAHSMTHHTTQIEVLGRSPSQIYEFMFALDREKYLAWHPEHLDFRIVKQTNDTLGSVFFFDEKMDKLRVKYRWEVVEIEPNHKIRMKALHAVPVYLTLTLQELPTGTLVTHDLTIGFERKITGFTDWFLMKFIFTKSKRRSIERHAKEEFKNLEGLIK